MQIQQVGIVGGGTMGNGIAQVFATSRNKVMHRDMGQAQLDRAIGTVQKSLGKFVEKGKMTAAESEAAFGRIATTTEIGDLANCDLIIEAIFENFDAKAAAFKELDALASKFSKDRKSTRLNSSHSQISYAVFCLKKKKKKKNIETLHNISTLILTS